MITVLAGGVGAARFLRGLIDVVDPATITAIVNTGDDTTLHGLRISPDLDTVTYTLADAIDPARGWGLVDETWRAMESLARYTPQRPQGSTAGSTWFNLGDQDLATHLYRTARLQEGATPTEVAAEVARAWGLEVSLLPMTDDQVATVVTVPGEGELSFQDYFVGRHHSVPVSAVRFDGVDDATLSPAAANALRAAEVVVVAPSNPIVSIGPIRALRGVDEALTARRESVVAISPIVAGAALKGPADRMLQELGSEPSVVGVARLYAPICAALVIDRADEHLAAAVEAEGVRCVVTDTIMSSRDVSAALARTTLAAGGVTVDR
jgi:LPPG:FO 2-phospho-L-lactate transferase